VTPEQRKAAIDYVQGAAAAARAAIESLTWWPWEQDAKRTQLGAVDNIVGVVVPAMQRLAGRGDDQADEKLVELGHTAEQSLASIAGYAASATFDSVLAATASATVHDAGALAVSAAGTALSIVPGKLWLALAVVGAGLAVVYFHRPRSAAAAS
jgi:hypothetical protein